MIIFRSMHVSARVASFLVSFILAASSAYASVEIEQKPLLVAQPVPGNMAIIGSFEFPTMVTRAYKAAYSTNGEYVGYFDSAKCYKYSFSDTEEQRHFYPVRFGTDCNEDDEWSGRYLNWATMQSIDIFRHILTGGYRHVDTPTETWLEKGVQTGQGAPGNNFPDANITSSIASSTPVPSNWSAVNTRIGISNFRMGNTMRFTGSGDLSNDPTAYDPATHQTNRNRSFRANGVYEVSIRVKVCVEGLLESNCQEYDNGNKPEGLIQANSSNMRYSAFGYINDNSNGSNSRNSEGGIMHARMKYVGPQRVDDNNVEESNPNQEWDESTGVFVSNPDPEDAAATDGGSSIIVNSGVISYINKSGLVRTDTEFKRFDNVSELYYTAYRYMKGLANLDEYINLPGNANSRARLVGGLPIIDWDASEEDDPIQFACQNNFFLGIGDTNTHNDKRIPKDDDPLSSDDFASLRAEISDNEGGTNVTGAGTGSDFISVLAYDAKTSDLRPAMAGRQTVSTYWIDILESGLKARRNNPYWLAAKYGGLDVADDFDPFAIPDDLPLSAWHTNGETLSTNDPRPDNFYVVASAQDMVDGLTSAFADIQSEQTGSRSSLALNSNALVAGSAAFQVRYTSGLWSGDVSAYNIDPSTRQLSPAPVWTASSKLPSPDMRNIKTWNGSAYVDFTSEAINNAALTNALTNDTNGTVADVINYLRGVRTNENNSTGFRVRENVIGDIVNSQPIFVGKPTLGLFRNRTFNGSSSYDSWVNSVTRTPVVYVGSNDGMLHGFNATTDQDASGAETFAYVPRTVIENGMGELASPSYDHRYFVDGEVTVADAYDGTNWRTILVGSLGAGGINKTRDGARNAIFALDVTDPDNVQFLWEKNSTEITELGNNLGRPVIAQIANGNWSVLLGNGPNGASGRASLISVNLFTGATTTTNMSTDGDNGLSAVRAWDSDGDGFTDTVYAGDLQGNLWKVTGLANNPRTIVKLFRAVDPSNSPQPITSSPLAGRSPYSQEVWLFFGTGQYLNNSDLTDTQVQSWYGINDNGGTVTVTRGDDLLERKILVDAPVSDDLTARVIEGGAREDLVGKRGWFIDLYQVATNGTRTALGERMITPNQFQGSALIGNTRIPDASDPCAPTGRGVIMSIDPFTGARLSDTFFDLNNDRSFTTLDMIEIDGVMTPPSGIGLNTGFSNPSFIDNEMFVPRDDTEKPSSLTNPTPMDSGRTSWRELINLDN